MHKYIYIYSVKLWVVSFYLVLYPTFYTWNILMHWAWEKFYGLKILLALIFNNNHDGKYIYIYIFFKECIFRQQVIIQASFVKDDAT